MIDYVDDTSPRGMTRLRHKSGLTFQVGRETGETSAHAAAQTFVHTHFEEKGKKIPPLKGFGDGSGTLALIPRIFVNGAIIAEVKEPGAEDITAVVIFHDADYDRIRSHGPTFSQLKSNINKTFNIVFSSPTQESSKNTTLETSKGQGPKKI